MGVIVDWTLRTVCPGCVRAGRTVKHAAWPGRSIPQFPQEPPTCSILCPGFTRSTDNAWVQRTLVWEKPQLWGGLDGFGAWSQQQLVAGKKGEKIFFPYSNKIIYLLLGPAGQTLDVTCRATELPFVSNRIWELVRGIGRVLGESLLEWLIEFILLLRKFLLVRDGGT